MNTGKLNTGARLIKKMPSWFDLDRYSGANRLDLLGWINQLYWRQMVLKAQMQWHFTEIVTQFQLPIQEAEFGLSRVISSAMPKDSLGCRCSLCEVPGANHQVGDSDGSCYLLHINLNLPGSILISAFKQWIKTASLNKVVYQKVLFSESIFRRWVTGRVLPYLDILHWANLNGGQVPNYILGEWLFPDGYAIDKTEKVRKTTEKLGLQLQDWRCLEAMRSQFEYESGSLLDFTVFYQERERLEWSFREFEEARGQRDTSL